MKNNYVSIGTTITLVILLVLLTDPFMLFMPPPMQMLALLGTAFFIIVFAGFVLFEKADDERELEHKLYAGRVAYLSGIAVLTIALVSQGLAHEIDPFICAALGVMIVTKILAHFYSNRYR